MHKANTNVLSYEGMNLIVLKIIQILTKNFSDITEIIKTLDFLIDNALIILIS